jgi:hypothetical protein
LGTNPPADLSYFSGPKYDLLLAHVGEAYALLVVLNPISKDDDLSKIAKSVYSNVGALLEILLNMGVTLKSEDQPEEEEVEIDTDELILDEDAPLIDALFQEVGANVPEAAEVDAFWDSVAEDSASNGLRNADALTYEQAVQLGLAPEEGEE